MHRDASGKVLERLLFRDDGKRLSAVPQEQAGTFDGDGRLFRAMKSHGCRKKLRRRRTAVGIPVMERYERVVFDKSGVLVTEAPPVPLVGLGHPLPEVVSDAVFEQYSGLLKCGTVLVDERDEGLSPRILFFL